MRYLFYGPCAVGVDSFKSVVNDQYSETHHGIVLGEHALLLHAYLIVHSSIMVIDKCCKRVEWERTDSIADVQGANAIVTFRLHFIT